MTTVCGGLGGGSAPSTTAAALLVRPDRHIAWRVGPGLPDDPAAELRRVLRQVAGPVRSGNLTDDSSSRTLRSGISCASRISPAGWS